MAQSPVSGRAVATLGRHGLRSRTDRACAPRRRLGLRRARAAPAGFHSRVAAALVRRRAARRRSGARDFRARLETSATVGVARRVRRLVAADRAQRLARRCAPTQSAAWTSCRDGDEAGRSRSAGRRIGRSIWSARWQRLRPPERVCIVLAIAEGMSHGEVARATGFPLGTVKSHIARGTARLRTLLEPE